MRNKQLSSLLKTLSLIFSFCLLPACASVTITESQLSVTRTSIPSYEESKNFYLWGLIGSHHVNVKEICRTKRPIRMQSQFTASDIFYGVITAGLYLPRTAKVWCQREGQL